MSRPALSLALAAGVLLAAGSARAARVIRWIQIHDHGEAVRRAARLFAERVERDSKGRLRVETLTRAEYATRHNGGKPVGELGLLRDLAAGKIELAQTYSNSLARFNSDLFVLGLPYLFQDYAHAEIVLDGPVGKELIDGFAGQSVRGLAFTYSGGFGFFAADRPLRSPEALKGLRMQTMRGRVSGWTATALDFEGLAGPPEAFLPLAREGIVDGLETTYSCFEGYGDDRYARVVTETGHFMLTTMIAANGVFLDGLSAADREIIRSAAVDVAREERRENAALEGTLRARLEKRGVKIIALTPLELAAFKKSFSRIYTTSAAVAREKLIRRIRESVRPKP